MTGSLDSLPADSQQVIAEILTDSEPALLARLRSTGEPTLDDRRAVTAILSTEFTEHLDADFEPTEHGRAIDRALGKFLLRWPIESNPEPAKWLEQDVADQLDADQVGTYELIWALNSSPFTLTAEEKREIARRVAITLATRNDVGLYRARWASKEPLRGPVGIDALDDDHLAWEPSEEYLVLCRTDNV